MSMKSAEALEELARLRDEILRCDQELVRIIEIRKRAVLQIGEIKEWLGLPITDPAREAAVVKRAAELARQGGVDEELVRDLIWRIMASARDHQQGRTRWGPPDPPDLAEQETA